MHIPELLARTGAGTSTAENVTQAFPVLGATPGVVYVVGPRYDHVPGDALVWTSDQWRRNVLRADDIAAYANGSYVGSVLRNPALAHERLNRPPTCFDIASTNSSVGVHGVGDLDAIPFDFPLHNERSSTSWRQPGLYRLNLPVEASWTFAGSGNPDEVHFYRLLKAGSASEEN